MRDKGGSYTFRCPCLDSENANNSRVRIGSHRVTKGRVPVIVELTARVVSAYARNNSSSIAGLPELIAKVGRSLSAAQFRQIPIAESRPIPSIDLRRTVQRDFIISLEDGKRYRMLKSHLRARGLTPEMYRQKWGLPHDYPMVAARYSELRSKDAKATGFDNADRHRAKPKHIR